MRNAQARTTYLKDYTPPPFTIITTDLHFDLFEDYATVVSSLVFKRNEVAGDLESDALILHGQNLTLEQLSINGSPLGKSDYLVGEETLTIPYLTNFLDNSSDQFTLACRIRIEPQKNTLLEGLCKSRRLFCTQCEAEGFRRITYYLDRPDVMSVFTTTVVADRKKYPVLLSNGNKVDSGVVESDSQRHWVKWHDPFKKPSYLFALVAGDLQSVDDQFVTGSGRKVALQVFVEEKDLDKCDHAMLSLKNAMRWDEKVYGREYDLDIFMIVAVDDFNMGAMENKGLNIFNTSCVLANPKTTSDSGFQRVEAVVAHEYFHNWSGNRVTCRDWFQLSLKEGFTVFRDAEFSADMGSRTVKRVEDVGFFRTVQFAEDGGPMSHSVRPDSYMEISNFYTVTIYEKGAEVVRMISELLGPEKFRAGSDLYFQRHDGQAVTTEDFVQAMEDASGIDLAQFRNWYRQAGTPLLDAVGNYDSSNSTFELTIAQSCPDTPGQSNKKPFHIPVKIGLLDSEGGQFALKLVGEEDGQELVFERVLNVTEAKQTYIFENITCPPVPSLLRGFSAPVKLNFNYSHEELCFLMVNDCDGFNRWNASQILANDFIGQLQTRREVGEELVLSDILLGAYQAVLDAVLLDADMDKAMVAQLLTPPTMGSLIEASEVADVDGIYAVREFLLDSLAGRLAPQFERVYQANTDQRDFSIDSDSIARRALKNLSLSYLVRSGNPHWISECQNQFNTATNMTDQMTALRCLVNSAEAAADELKVASLAAFYEQWSDELLVVDQWFQVQAACQLPGTLERVKSLMAHDDFEIMNPNKVRALIGVFCNQNYVGFHNKSGEGYGFLADQVLVLDKINPQIAARLLTPLTRWRKYDPQRGQLMLAQLERIKADEKLSKDVFEVVEKSSK